MDNIFSMCVIFGTKIFYVRCENVLDQQNFRIFEVPSGSVCHKIKLQTNDLHLKGCIQPLGHSILTSEVNNFGIFVIFHSPTKLFVRHPHQHNQLV
jgi:hypothetical protein